MYYVKCNLTQKNRTEQLSKGIYIHIYQYNFYLPQCSRYYPRALAAFLHNVDFGSGKINRNRMLIKSEVRENSFRVFDVDL